MTTTINVQKDPRDRNQRIAENLREELRRHGVFCINMMSSPGSGKTTLLEKSLPVLARDVRLAVIEADNATTRDADRLAKLGIAVEPILTGVTGCHIAPPSAQKAFAALNLAELDLVVIENVGNLVCPAEEDLGEDAKVVLLSVAEGEDKPQKYPLAFQEGALALINKIDAAEALGADVDLMEANIRAANPQIEIMRISARTGDGVEAFIAWLRRGMARKYRV